MKSYIKPIVTETKVDLMPLMANSVRHVAGDIDDINITDEEFAGGTADVRRHNVWDDMEEEEED
jgi:hypothetical protein